MDSSVVGYDGDWDELREEKPCGTKEARSEERANAQARNCLAEMDWLPWYDTPGLAAGCS